MKYYNFLMFTLIIPFTVIAAEKKNEDYYNDLFCDEIGGKREVRHHYSYSDGKSSYVIVDCETETEVIEGGLDKRSSLDSIQQALFFAHITGKKPVVVIYDTDRKWGKYEYRIQNSSKIANVKFVSFTLRK